MRDEVTVWHEGSPLKFEYPPPPYIDQGYTPLSIPLPGTEVPCPRINIVRYRVHSHGDGYYTRKT